MVTHETETIVVHPVSVYGVDCPACGGWYVEDTPCECGYCPHAGVIDGIRPECGAEVEPTMAELVAELLDAADLALMALDSIVGYSRELPSANRLRQIVTRLQGTAGLRVSASDSPAGGAS